VITLAELKSDDGVPYRAFVCHTLNQWNYPAKDRSGRLDVIEEPHLGRLMDKIAGEFMLLAGALVLSLFAGWRIRDQLGEELLAGATAGWQRQVPRILWVLRWVVPAIVAVVLAFSLRGTLAAVAEFFGGGVPFQPG